MKYIKRGTQKTIRDVALRNLGVADTEEINNWFRKSYAGKYRVDGIDEAIDLLCGTQWDRVQVVGDYDVDGCTATAEMKLALSVLGFPVHTRVPHRFSEGFGLNTKIIEEIPGGKTLLITVDNGIAANEAVALAKQRGMTVIITDHHLPAVTGGRPDYPDADLIIDPNAVPNSADFNGYCGAGLAYKFLTRLLDRKIEELTDEREINKLKAIRIMLLPLCAMGTVADVMELKEENFVFVRNGLRLLENRKATAGMMSLHDRLWVTHPTADDIAFKSGPCVNANGRLYDDGADRSIELLSCLDYREAEVLVAEAIQNNQDRKAQVEAGLKKAEEIIEKEHMAEDLPMVLYLPKINEGIVGILAGKLSEAYGTVAMVFTDSDEEGILKGSGRSTESINLKAMLDAISSCFTRYGGHAEAAGMSIEETRLSEMRKAAMAYAKKQKLEHEPVKDLYFDLSIDAKEVPELLPELVKYGPFGQGNEPIVFEIKNFSLLPGRDGQLRTKLGANGVKLTNGKTEAVCFDGKLSEEILKSKSLNYTLYGTLSYSYFRGEAKPQIGILGVQEAEKPAFDSALMQTLLETAARK